jgi:hypothetical protein
LNRRNCQEPASIGNASYRQSGAKRRNSRPQAGGNESCGDRPRIRVEQINGLGNRSENGPQGAVASTSCGGSTRGLLPRTPISDAAPSWKRTLQCSGSGRVACNAVLASATIRSTRGRCASATAKRPYVASALDDPSSPNTVITVPPYRATAFRNERMMWIRPYAARTKSDSACH